MIIGRVSICEHIVMGVLVHQGMSHRHQQGSHEVVDGVAVILPAISSPSSVRVFDGFLDAGELEKDRAEDQLVLVILDSIQRESVGDTVLIVQASLTNATRVFILRVVGVQFDVVEFRVAFLVEVVVDDLLEDVCEKSVFGSRAVQKDSLGIDRRRTPHLLGRTIG
jgi:hypothetical protein